MSAEVVQIILDTQRETLRRMADMRDHMGQQDRHLEKQDEHLGDQDAQRKLMWTKIDQIAEALLMLPKLNERLAVVEKHAPGLAWASAFRQGLIWIGLAAITALMGAGAAVGVGWAWAHRHLGGGS